MINADDTRLSKYERELIAMRGDGAKLSDEEMLACCALGLAEETAEVLFAMDGRSGNDALSEIGDVLWYATTAAHRIDRSLSEIQSIETNTEQDRYDEDEDYAHPAIAYAGVFAGLVKKWLYHDKPLNHQLAAKYLAEIVECASRMASQLDRVLGDAQDANLAKLRKRFPSGGFTAAEANARADETSIADESSRMF